MKRTGLVFLLLCAMFQMGALNAAAKSGFGEDATVKDGVTVNDDMSVIGGDLTVYGTITGDAKVIAGSIIVESGGQIKGDAMVIGGDVRVRDGGVIRNDAFALGGKVVIDNGGIVMGEISNGPQGFRGFRGFPNPLRFPGHLGRGFMNMFVFGPFAGIFGSAGIVIGLLVFMFKMLFSLAIAVIITYLFPDSVHRMAATLQEDFPRAAMFGFAFTILIPFMVLFMILTIVGIMLVPFYIILLIFMHIFGSVGVALWIGRIIPESEDRTILINVVLGVLVIGILKNIPVIGFIIGMVITFSAFGVVLMSWSRSRQHYVAS